MRRTDSVIYIVDDDTDFRESLEALVVMSGFKAYAFPSAEEFLAYSLIKRPACLLLDVFLPNIDGFHLQRKLQERGLSIPIIFITGHGDVPMGIKAMKEGAADFLLKPFDGADLNRAILAALGRDDEFVRNETVKADITSRIDLLTQREQEVMRQVITGKLNKQIATTLGIAEKTVRIHRSHLMRKLRVPSVAALVRMLAMVGIVHTPTEIL